MFKFRGKRIDTGEWVVGWYNVNSSGQCLIWSDMEWRRDWSVIHPHSLSVSTGKLDSNGVEIFASYPIDGVMTTGGDVVKMLYGSSAGAICNAYYSVSDSQFLVHRIDRDMVYEMSSFYSNHITIIGKQSEVVNENL